MSRHESRGGPARWLEDIDRWWGDFTKLLDLLQILAVLLAILWLIGKAVKIDCARACVADCRLAGPSSLNRAPVRGADGPDAGDNRRMVRPGAQELRPRAAQGGPIRSETVSAFRLACPTGRAAEARPSPVTRPGRTNGPGRATATGCRVQSPRNRAALLRTLGPPRSSGSPGRPPPRCGSPPRAPRDVLTEAEWLATTDTRALLTHALPLIPLRHTCLLLTAIAQSTWTL